LPDIGAPMEPSLHQVVLALADEGVPIRAIARATRIPSSDLREKLAEARDIGDLLELPLDEQDFRDQANSSLPMDEFRRAEK
jgi:hypothetical protein